MRRYERHAICQTPGPDDWQIVEIRDDGTRRLVAPDHHALQEYLASGGDLVVCGYCAPDPLPRLTLAEARSQAVAELQREYLQAIGEWDAYGLTSKAEALARWKEAVASRVKELTA